MATVAIYGAGQLGTTVAEILKDVPHHKVLGVFGRDKRDQALTSGADVVIIATTTKFKDGDEIKTGDPIATCES